MLRALVVAHHPSTVPAVGRLLELAGGVDSAGISWMQLPAIDIGSEGSYVGVRLDRDFPVVHLLPDAAVWGAAQSDDAARAAWEHLVGNMHSVHGALVAAHPSLAGSLAHWVVTSLGSSIEDVESTALGSLLGEGAPPGFRGLFSVSTSTATAALSPDHRLVGMADVAYSLVCSSMADMIHERRGGLFHAGVASVVFRARRTAAAVLSGLAGAVQKLTGALDPTDTSAGVGRTDIDDGVLGLRRNGESNVADRLGQEPLVGNVRHLVGNRLDEIDRSVAGVDPGLWAGLLGYEIDRLTVVSGEGDGPVSPLAAAVAQIGRNFDQAAVDLEKMVRDRAADHFRNKRSLASTTEWCRGASEALRDVHARLQLASTDLRNPQMNMADRAERLRKASQWLPDGNAVFVRGIVLVLMTLVSVYTYAFVPRLVALILGLRLPFIGDELESNSQLWARLTAGTVGVLIGLWWVALWARAVRWRRRYLRAAGEVVNGRIDEEIRLHLVRLVEHLMRVVGPSDEEMSITGWVTRARPELEALGEVLGSPPDDRGVLLDSPFCLELPSEADVATYRRRVTPDEGTAMQGSFIDALEGALRSGSATAPLLEPANLIPVASGLPTDIRRYFETHREFVASSHDLLDGDLRPRSGNGQASTDVPLRYLIVESEVARLLGGSGWRHPEPTVVQSYDAQFVCSIWLVPLRLERGAE